jgi:hypothetical protein
MSKAQNGCGPRAADLKFTREGFRLLLKLGKRLGKSVRVRAGQTEFLILSASSSNDGTVGCTRNLWRDQFAHTLKWGKRRRVTYIGFTVRF